MTNIERAEIIQNSIRDYKAAKSNGEIEKIKSALNDMENTYIAVCRYSVPGTEELRKSINEARSKGF